MSETNNQTQTTSKKQSNHENKKFVTKPIINSSLYFSMDGKYLIFEKTEKHIFPASYHMKLVDNELVKNKGEQQCAT